MPKKISLLTLLILASIFTLSDASAQTPATTLESLLIELRPEYDAPAMLVIYQARVSPNVDLPVEAALRIPVTAGPPDLVSVHGDSSETSAVEYRYEMSGEWGIVRFPVSLPNIQIEYHDLSLDLSSELRTYTYIWPGDFAVDLARLQIQQPFGVQDITTSPHLRNVSQIQSGLIFHWADVGALRPGESFEIELAYRKSNDSLTVEFLPIQAAGSIDTMTPGRISVIDIVPWGVGILGVLVIIVGVYWYWVSGQSPGGNERFFARTLAIDQPPAASEGEFCHQCGKRTFSGDRYCRACGARLQHG